MIAYRDATAADGPTLDAMAKASWLQTFGHVGYAADDLAAYLAEAYGPGGQLIRELGDPALPVRLALADDDVVGYAKLGPRRLPAPEPDPAAQELRQLYVLGPWHGTGVAAELMRWTVAAARARGAPALYLSVWEENHRARAFYARYGFVHVSDFAYPVGRHLDRDLVLRLPL